MIGTTEHQSAEFVGVRTVGRNPLGGLDLALLNRARIGLGQESSTL